MERKKIKKQKNKKKLIIINFFNYEPSYQTESTIYKKSLGLRS